MLNRRCFALSALLAGASGAAPVTDLHCRQRVSLLTGGRADLEVELHNRGRQALRLLSWGTPFEGAWFRPVVALFRDGVAQPYRGAMMKRGEPSAEDYFDLAAGGRRRVRLRLGDVFDVSAPGRYRVEAQWRWSDAYALPGPPFRPLAEHQAFDQACADVEVRRD